jgi:hypothetical protein
MPACPDQCLSHARFAAGREAASTPAEPGRRSTRRGQFEGSTAIANDQSPTSNACAGER